MPKEEIPFTEEHVEAIRNGEKQTTMRTVKKDNLYRVGEKYQVAEDLVVKVTMRQIITFGPKVVEAFDEGTEIFPNTPAKHDALSQLEGFRDDEEYPDEGQNSIGKMLEWFESRNYNLPQEFFLYKMNPMKMPDKEDEEGDSGSE